MSDCLAARFGAQTMSRTDPVETLVRTILSQNTTNVNRDRAYTSLLTQFLSLDRIADAEEAEVAEAIRVGGLHQQKARSIVTALRRIREKQGDLDLSFLDDLDLESSLEWLLALPGVGRKTAGIVLLFSFRKPYFPIDTHIGRVLTRVGLIRGREEPHRRMNAVLPADPELMATLHLLLIHLGRTICHPRRPNCPICPIRARCSYAKTGDQGAASSHPGGGGIDRR
jgi:endonuclease-3